jgi:predicted RNA-binding protein YlqC (UPF0109 family)
MKDTILSIVSAIVENKEAVAVESQEEENTVVYTIKVAPEDMGRIIGKSGKTISSLRTIFKAAGLKNHQNIRLEVN